MATLKEILAAKKAAALGQSVPPVETQADAKPIADGLAAMDFSVPSEQAPTPVADTVIKAEPAAVVSQKPMSFAERIALKKQQAAQATPAPAPTAPAQASISLTPKAPALIELSEAQKSVVAEQDNEELAQAYTDIAITINKLQYADDGEDLSKAMTDLKRALRQNMSASMLVLDTDIGQMAMALRRYTGEALEEAKEKKASGKAGAKKASNVTMTPEEIAAALADL